MAASSSSYKFPLFNHFLLALSLWVVQGSFVSASAATGWHWRYPLPSGESYRACIYTNGLFVAVGLSGCVQNSPDGVSWNVIPQPTSNNLNGLAYGDGLYVAVGDNGTILTSSDGTNWTPATSGTSNSLAGVAYGNSMFMATGVSGTVLVSTNGTQWASANPGVANTLSWVVFGSGKFMVPAPPSAVLVSSNGSTWSTNTLPEPWDYISAVMNTFTYGNGLFVGNVTFNISGDTEPGSYNYASPDGVNWTFSPIPGAGSGLFYFDSLNSANGQFFEVNGAPGYFNQLFISTNGQSWTAFSAPYALAFLPGNFLYMRDVAYGAGLYVSLGDMGTFASSTDGMNWITSSNIAYGSYNPFFFSSIASTPSNVTVAVGGYFVTQSGDALTGQPAPIFIATNNGPFGAIPGGATPSLTSIAYGATNFVAVGLAGALQLSPDGVNWTTRPSGTSSDLTCICYGNGTWVGVGMGGAIVSSVNSLVWSLRSSTTGENLFGITYGGGQFVAVGEQGTVVISPDGINWTLQYVAATANLSKVAYGNGIYVAVGTGGAVETSPDGINWTAQSSGVTSSLTGIAFLGGQFTTFSFSSSINFPQLGINTILQSANGVTWSRSRSLDDWAILGVSAYNGTLWATGANGNIIQSAPASTQPFLLGSFARGSGLFSVSVFNAGGLNYKIQSRPDASSGTWSDAMTVTNSPATVTWTDTNSSTSKAAFFIASSRRERIHPKGWNSLYGQRN